MAAKRMSRWLKWLCWAAALSVAALCIGLLVFLACVPRAIPPHVGDGEFADLTYGVPVVFTVPGYVVSFPRFDLGSSYTATNHVTRLPDIGRDCRLHLAIDDPREQWLFKFEKIRALRGSLRLEVLDSEGAVLGKCEGPLSDYIWGHWRGAHRLYQLAGPSFRPDTSAEYTVRVSYEPDPGLASFEGYGYLECGGHP